jgi:hypothetical protein
MFPLCIAFQQAVVEDLACTLTELIDLGDGDSVFCIGRGQRFEGLFETRQGRG